MKKIRTSVELLPGQARRLQEIAASLGYVQRRGVGTGEVGSIAALMQAIADGRVKVACDSGPVEAGAREE